MNLIIPQLFSRSEVIYSQVEEVLARISERRKDGELHD